MTRRILLLSLFISLLSADTVRAQGDIVINEIFPTGSVELKNIGPNTIDVSTYWLCNFPENMMLAQGNLECGSLLMGPGDIVVVNDFSPINMADGEMGLFINGDFGNPNSILDYMEWGAPNHQRSAVAAAAGIWILGEFVPAMSAGESIEYIGAGDGAASWIIQDNPSICGENGTGNPCTAEGGIIGGGPFQFCIDNESDFVTDISLTGNTGANSQWLVTNQQGLIIQLPTNVEDVDFNTSGLGLCYIWHLSYDEGLMGLAIGSNAGSDLIGCFDLSNSIEVSKIDCNQCDVVGGFVGSNVIEVCIDSIPDFQMGIVVSDWDGPASSWVITDTNGEIISLPADPNQVDFNDAQPGICQIWYLAYESGLEGLEVGNSVADLNGCYDFSADFITVNRDFCDSCAVNGGSVGYESYTFCIDDGIPDLISGAVTGNSGPENQWVVTDQAGLILGLPNAPGDIDFSSATAGVCLVWHLSYEGTIDGLEIGGSALELEGCHDLSDDFISVQRILCDTCSVTGGMISGGPFTFCVGDGASDFIDEGEISLTPGNAAFNQWIVTDEDGMILDLPASYTDVDFEGAAVGTCLVYHLSFDDVEGLSSGANIADLTGCYELAEGAIEVIRVSEGTVCTNSIAEEILENTLTIYPNPVQDVLHVVTSSSVELEARIRLYDVSGRMVSEVFSLLSEGIVVIPVHGFDKGMYTLIISTESAQINRTIVKVD